MPDPAMEDRGQQEIRANVPAKLGSSSGYPGKAGVSGNATSLLEDGMYYVLWAGPLGNFWRGPFRREQVVGMAARGAVSLDVTVHGPQGEAMTVNDVVNPPSAQESGWVTLAKVLFGAAVVTGVAAVVREVLRDPEPKRIEELAARLERRSVLVFADIKGHRQPPVLNGSRPDVYAVLKTGKEIAIEVENDRSVDRHHAREQVRNLRAWADRSEHRSFRVEVVEGGRGGKS